MIRTSDRICLLFLIILCLLLGTSMVVTAGPPPYTVWGQVTLGEGEIPFPNAEIHIDRVYNDKQYGITVILSDWLGNYKFKVTEPAHRLKIWVIPPPNYKVSKVYAPVIAWGNFISWDNPPGPCGPIWWIMSRGSTPTVTPSRTPSLIPTILPSLAPSMTPNPTPSLVPSPTPSPTLTGTPLPEPTLPPCTPWPTLMPITQVLIDSVNASRNQPIVINWGGIIQKAAYQHYAHLAMSSEILVEYEGARYIAQGWYEGVFYYVQSDPDVVYYTTWFGSGGIVHPCLSYVDTEGSFEPPSNSSNVEGVSPDLADDLADLPQVSKPTIRIPTDTPVVGFPTIIIPTPPPNPDMPDSMLGVNQEHLRTLWRMENVIYVVSVAILGLIGYAARQLRKQESDS